MRGARGRGGVTTGDALLALAVTALLLAGAYPRLERAAMHRRADAIAAEVEEILAAATRHRDESGSWPAGAPSGTVPPTLVPYLPSGFAFRRDGYILRVDRWVIVETPPPVDLPEEMPIDERTETLNLPTDTMVVPEPLLVPVAGITVQCDDARILARLQERFGVRETFVRGATWTLVVPPGAPPP